jgi:carbohydrate-binding DOMON domain-containing protein
LCCRFEISRANYEVSSFLIHVQTKMITEHLDIVGDDENPGYFTFRRIYLNYVYNTHPQIELNW